MADRVERDEKLIDQIGKLLAVAASTKNPDEKQAFEAKAMALIAQNNLDMAAIEIGGNSAKAAKRADEKHKGGLYQFQRDLWGAVADLNFCMYWNLYTYDPNKVSKYWARQYGGVAKVPEHRRGGYHFEHRLVGRVVNIAATRTMAGYLEEAIERAVRERLPNQPNLWFSSDMAAFREGASDEIRRKIYDRRRKLLDEEQRKADEVKRAADDLHAATGSTENAVTLTSVKQSEEEANYDHLHGEGAFAKKKAREAKWDQEWADRMAARAQEQRDAEAAYTKWAEENPKEAAAQEAKRRKAESRRSYSYRPKMETAQERRQNSSEYSRGREAGKKIGIDQQMGGGAKGLLS